VVAFELDRWTVLIDIFFLYAPILKVMALDEEVKKAILAESSDFTYQELATRHGCSKSTVQRLVSRNVAPSEGDSFASDTATEIRPEVEEEKQEVFDAADPGLSSFLSSITEAEAEPEQREVDFDVQEVSFDQAEQLARSIGVDVDKKSRRKGRVRAPKPAPSSSSPLTTPEKAALPLAMQRVQLSLYLSTFRQQLMKGGYAQSDSEIDAQIQEVKVMQAKQLEDRLGAVKGVLTLETSVSSMKNAVLMCSGLASTLGPSVGIQLQGWDAALARQQEELSAAATFVILEDWDYYSNSVSGKSRMGMFLLQSAMQCHRQHQSDQTATYAPPGRRRRTSPRARRLRQCCS
jgi:hypothetical protein